uniref:Peroxidase n=1 Tax=Caenorhabditis japonica TaxID=281687 RepID=A0A8R1DJT4_CAEJA
MEVTEESERIVEDAVMRALETMLNQENSNANNASSSEKRIIDSQQANADSKSAQFTGEVLEEATRVLVKEFGMDIIPVANAVINKWKLEEEDANGQNENATEVPERRKKRQAMLRSKRQSRNSSDCSTFPADCNDRFHTTTRTITGNCNNRQNPELGNSVTTLRRVLGGAFYADGLGRIRTRSVTGEVLPSARLISNSLHDDRDNEVFSSNTNHLHMIIGQFIAHDMVFIPSSVARGGEALDCSSCNSPQTVSANCAPIQVPLNDDYFKIPCMRLTRALNGQENFGVRSQIGQNSHFLDLSTVYGSSNCEMDSVRSFREGKLSTFTDLGYVLPPQNRNDTNCLSSPRFFCFTCGDFRNSLHPALIPVHTIFIKEHNRLADLVRSRRRDMSDEQIFQLVRKILIGMWQHIVYNEYLPKYLPQRTLRNFGLTPLRNRVHLGYDPQQDPSISAEFAGAAFRFGHSQARFVFTRKNAAGRPRGDYDLGFNVFYASQNYLSGIGGWEPVMNGMVQTAGMKTDRYFTFSIRNQMFEIRGRNGSGVDLVSVNIQRGRDIGLFPYIMYREFVGLPVVTTFDDLNTTFSQENIDALRSVYSDPMDIDLYTGMMLEENMAGAQLGPTAVFLVAEQFKASKIGDRFYYESVVQNTDNFNLEEMNEIRDKVTLAKFICTNMDSINRINSDIFDFQSNQVNCSSLPEINIDTFLR